MKLVNQIFEELSSNELKAFKKELNQIQKKYPKTNTSIVVTSSGKISISGNSKDAKSDGQVSKLHSELKSALLGFAKKNKLDFMTSLLFCTSIYQKRYQVCASCASGRELSR